MDERGLEKLSGPGLISVVGQAPEEATAAVAAPSPYLDHRILSGTPEQASKLRAELERRKLDFRSIVRHSDDVAEP